MLYPHYKKIEQLNSAKRGIRLLRCNMSFIEISITVIGTQKTIEVGNCDVLNHATFKLVTKVKYDYRAWIHFVVNNSRFFRTTFRIDPRARRSAVLAKFANSLLSHGSMVNGTGSEKSQINYYFYRCRFSLIKGKSLYLRQVDVVHIINSRFKIDRDGSQCSDLGCAVNLETREAYLENVTFDSTLTDVQSVSVLLIQYDTVRFADVLLLCPFTSTGEYHEYKGTKTYGIVENCKQVCEDDMFSHKRGIVTLADSAALSRNRTDLIMNSTEPVCQKCPIGINCGTNLFQPLPNYWGYKNQDNSVSMVRCPDGYCCQGRETCKEYNSCNTLRTGTLCGICEKNWTESLFSPRCVSAANCSANLIILLYVAAVMMYSIILLTMKGIKSKFISAAAYLFKKVKLVLNRSSKHKTVEKTKIEKVVLDEGKEDDDMKYIQILCYYVQDATLFKVYFPGTESNDEEFIVKVLQFSPEFIGTLYNKATQLCFGESTTAIHKVLFKSLFGPSVMFFLLVIYLVQQQLIRYFGKRFALWQSLRASLMKAFLLVILLAYQNIVIGAFRLVKCVEISDDKVLYIQANVRCYTSWQIAIQVFICVSIIPIFFVLSHSPFYVRERKMSVLVFVVSCLLPLPAMIAFHIIQCCRREKLENVELTEDDDFGPSILVTMGNELQVSESRNFHSDTDIGMQYSTDSINDIDLNERFSEESSEHSTKDNLGVIGSQENPSDCREEIVKALLEHYKTLKLFGVRFTWLGIHKLYRVMLVACNTFIADPLTRICLMMVALLIIALMNSVIKPYKGSSANATAAISYAANICIAIINVVRAIMIDNICQYNCSNQILHLEYLQLAEKILMIYLPVVAICLWAISVGINKCMKKE